MSVNRDFITDGTRCPICGEFQKDSGYLEAKENMKAKKPTLIKQKLTWTRTKIYRCPNLDMHLKAGVILQK